METIVRDLTSFSCPACGGMTRNEEGAIKEAKAKEGRIRCNLCNAPLRIWVRLSGAQTTKESFEDLKDLFSTSYAVTADVEAEP
jgi:hypothetical protein